MNAEARIPFLPGERVRCKRRLEGRALRAAFNGRLKAGQCYHVRGAYVDRYTGKEYVRLIGIYGPVGDDGAEIGVPSSLFESAGSRIQAFTPDAESMCYVDVRVTPGVASALEGVPLFPVVEEFFIFEDGKLEVACRRWTNSWHVSKPPRDMHREIAAAVEKESGVVIRVPLSGLGTQDLADICHRLGIESEAWLQGVLGNLALRFRKLREAYDMAQRIAAKNKARLRDARGQGEGGAA